MYQSSKNRLIAFGCSYTYGHGLSDCIIEGFRPGLKPSEFAWPSHLGKMLGKDVINDSRAGSSNLEILYRILNFDFNPTDIVVILWSYSVRDMIFVENGPNKILGAWIDDADIEPWLRIHSNYDLLMRSWFNVHHAKQYLENNSINNYNFFIDPEMKLSPECPKFKDRNNVYLKDLLLNEYDRALDKSHPGPIAHLKAAEKINEYISGDSKCL